MHNCKFKQPCVISADSAIQEFIFNLEEVEIPYYPHLLKSFQRFAHLFFFSILTHFTLPNPSYKWYKKGEEWECMSPCNEAMLHVRATAAIICGLISDPSRTSQNPDMVTWVWNTLARFMWFIVYQKYHKPLPLPEASLGFCSFFPGLLTARITEVFFLWSIEFDNHWTFSIPDLRLERHSAPH